MADKPIFSVQQTGQFIQGGFDLKLKGDPQQVVMMLAGAIEQSEPARVTVLAAVAAYFSIRKNSYELEQFKSML